MASSKERQRRLERAKVERRMAKQAAALRRRRQLQASVGASLALVLIVVGAVWLLGGFDPDEEQTVASGTCTWFSEQLGGDVLDTGVPPTTGEARTGTSVVTIKTNQGDIVAELDHEKAPCTTASMAYLAGRQFYDDTTCHRLTTQGIFVLQCGDPKASGSGSPAYRFANEWVPPAPTPSPGATAPSVDPTAKPQVTYPRGTLAMAHSSEPDSNGSQFFIVYKDSPLAADYTVFGKVTQGLDVVDKVAAAGVADGSGDGKPKTETKIVSLSIAPGAAGTPGPTSAAPTGATPATPTGAAPTSPTTKPTATVTPAP